MPAAAGAAGLISLPYSTVVTAIFFFFFFFLLHHHSIAVTLCGLSSCSGVDSSYYPLIHFPFRLRTQQDDPRCGYSPAFDLFCDTVGRTILTLPGAGDFAVDRIDYQTQTILLSELESSCFPRRLLENSSLLFGSSVFRPLFPTKFELLNCSAAPMFPMAITVPCLREGNFTVISVPSRIDGSSYGCEELGSIIFPVLQPYWSSLDSTILLTWSTPDCGSCEESGGLCGFKNDNGSEIGCTSVSSPGLPRAAKYGIVFGAGVPGLLCTIGLVCFICRRIKTYRHRSRTSADFSALTAPRPMLLSVGLDRPTIESYPKTELGESKRLPNPSDNICSICLSEYQPKEILRSIPECNHYFHANCIDEWLTLNATCPLCRNSP